MIRMNFDSPNVKPTDWLNALQDEVCTPIEKTGELSSRLDQLKSAVEAIMTVQNIHLWEMADYSGNPVPLGDLSIHRDECLSFLLHVDASLKAREPGAIPDPLKAVELPGELDQELDTSSSNFANLSSILSSDNLLQKNMSGTGYEAMQLPDVAGLSRAQTVQIVREQNARKYIASQTTVIPYTIGWSDKGFANCADPLPFQNYSTAIQRLGFQFQDPPQSGSEEQPNLGMLLYFAVTPIPPVYVAANESGKLHAFYNRMLYGDALRVKLGIFNLNRIAL